MRRSKRAYVLPGQMAFDFASDVEVPSVSQPKPQGWAQPKLIWSSRELPAPSNDGVTTLDLMTIERMRLGLVSTEKLQQIGDARRHQERELTYSEQVRLAVADWLVAERQEKTRVAVVRAAFNSAEKPFVGPSSLEYW